MNTTSAISYQGFSEPVAGALAEWDDLKIDPSQLEDLPEYSIMIGGFGTVRVAKFGDQIVAIKELRVTGSPTDRARFSVRFARELQIWAPLDHPNLLKLSGFYVDADMTIAQFICPFYARGHIRKYIEAYNPDRDTRLQLAKDTALGLQHLHELHIVHGDLKELNVLVDHEPRALLCDYGIARMMNADATNSGLTTSGSHWTVRFASPELLDGMRPDLASDVWAWGCLFLKITADVGPYDNTTDVACIFKIAQGIPPVDLSSLNMDKLLQGMLERCWNKEPLPRPTVAQCIEIIELTRSQQHPADVHDNAKRYWDPLSTISIHTLDCQGTITSSVAFSPDGSLIASMSPDGRGGVQMWNVDTGLPMAKLQGSYRPVIAIAFSSNGSRLAVAIEDGNILIWDPTPGQTTVSSGSHILLDNTTRRISTPRAITCIALSPTGSRVAGGFMKGRVRMWDALSRTLLGSWEGHINFVTAVAFSTDGVWLTSSSHDGTVRIRDANSSTTLRMSSEKTPMVTLKQHTDWVSALAFSPNGEWLASGSDDKKIILWSASSWTPLETLESEDGVFSLAFSHDSTRLASGTRSGTIEVWDMASMKTVKILEGHEDYVASVEFSPDGRRIVSGSFDETIRIWHAMPSAVSDALDEAPA